MASEELASFLYNLFRRFLSYCIIFEFLYLSGLSCVHFIPSKSGELNDFIPSKICGIKCLPLRSITFGVSRGIQVNSLTTIRSGRSYRKSGEVASGIASFLYNIVCRFCIIFEILYSSGLSCVHFTPSKSGELKDFIPSKTCGIKSLRMFTTPVRYIVWKPWNSSQQSNDNKIWKIV